MAQLWDKNGQIVMKKDEKGKKRVETLENNQHLRIRRRHIYRHLGFFGWL